MSGEPLPGSHGTQYGSPVLPSVLLSTSAEQGGGVGPHVSQEQQGKASGQMRTLLSTCARTDSKDLHRAGSAASGDQLGQHKGSKEGQQGMMKVANKDILATAKSTKLVSS